MGQEPEARMRPIQRMTKSEFVEEMKTLLDEFDDHEDRTLEWPSTLFEEFRDFFNA